MVCGKTVEENNLVTVKLLVGRHGIFGNDLIALNRTQGKTNKPKVLAESVPTQKCCFNGFIQVKADIKIG